MDNVWLITLLGMGTVFLALIFLWGVTAQFPRIFGGRSEKKRPEAAPLPQIHTPMPAAPAAAPKAGTAGNPGPELVAVIAAAVAAASGAAPGSFRIASIQPSAYEGGFNTPIWGRVERLIRQ